MRIWSHTGRCVGIVSLSLALGCGAQDAEAPPEAAVDPASTLEPLPAAPPAADPVPETLPEIVARVNTHDITNEELERAVRSAEIQAGQALPTQFRDQVYRSVLDRLVSFHLLLQESESRGIAVDDAVVEDRMESLKSNFPTAEAFETQLSDWDTTLEILRGETRRDLAVELVLETAVTPDVDIDVETTRAFYDQHTDQFTQGGGAEARHILIGLSPDAGEDDKTAARTRAESVASDLAAGGDFVKLAQAHSEDQGSAANGGDLGTVVKGQTVPAFEAALFALSPGETSGVVETPFGFHIIEMTALEDASTVPFAEAGVQIREFLVRQEQQARTEAFVAELRANGDIEILI